MSGYSTCGWDVGALRTLDWQESVLDKDLAIPPVAPTAGDRYIVAAGAVGDWATYDNYIATCTNSIFGFWQFDEPDVMTCVGVEDEGYVYIWNGSAWVNTGLSMGGYADGDATVAAWATSVTVTHGLPSTPAIGDIQLTAGDDIGGRTVYPSAITATTFDINMVPADAIDHVILWRIEV